MKLISLNLEGHKHFDLQVPFFLALCPDVLCLQEVRESDVVFLKNALKMNGHFAPMCSDRILRPDGSEAFEPRGIAILSKLSLGNFETHYYFGSPDILHELVIGLTLQEDIQKVLLVGKIIFQDKVFYIGTTHFTWSSDGKVDDRQQKDLQALLEKLSLFPEVVFCGDFNAPRGGEIFAAIAQKYKDNIPAAYTTSIDGNLHRNGHIPFMVDGLFSTSGYQVSNVRLQGGVSDHCAIVAEVD